MDNKDLQQDNILFYETADSKIHIDVFLQDEDVWLTQKKMASLFGIQENTITYHLQEVFKSGELKEDSTARKIRVVQTEGNRQVNREVTVYNLDAIISVGYRVNSMEATKFRIWATRTLKEYIKKGFVLDEERLRNGSKFGQDYFDELLVKIKEIRASERRFYQKITDIFATCSYDYNKDSEITKNFYATIQNKLHFAITGNTAAEIIYNRVNSKKEHMGLTTWKDAPKGKILETDVTIAKNYLDKDEMFELNDIVSSYLDFAERQVRRHKLMSMQEWKDRMDIFLKSNDMDILDNLGKTSKKVADKLALEEYEKYRVIQDKEFLSDFDNLVIENKSEA